LYQVDPENPKMKFYNYFGSITFNEREARFSQPKRELYGLLMALRASKYQTFGCRPLTVETDASYIKGMLNNPDSAPNASINRWIEEIRLYHFELVHIKGLVHGPDGLSRPPPGGISTPRPEGWEEFLVDDDGQPVKFRMGDGIEDEPFDIDTFKDDIDPRSGYLVSLAEKEPKLATSVFCYLEDLRSAVDEANFVDKIRNWALRKPPDYVSTFLKQVPVVPPAVDDSWNDSHPYKPIHEYTNEIKRFDEKVPQIEEWLLDPEADFVSELSKNEMNSFITLGSKFFLDPDGRLYKRSTDGSTQHRLYVVPDKRMWMLVASHDHLGHKGMFATKSIMEKRFWWPHMDKDIDWFVRSCQECQDRRLDLLRIPPVVTHTPSLFQVIHVDVLSMTPASNSCKLIVHGRCALSRWSEARAIQSDTARILAEWFFDDIISRWGCPEEVVTDNAPQMIAMARWLTDKYGVRSIKISPYNSQANGKIERAHFDLRSALSKAVAGDLAKWYWFLKHILWADRVTTRKDLGCSPYFFVTGAEPILPLDIVESTWLVKLPNRFLSREELIGFRAQALAKHRTHVTAMRDRITEEKRRRLIKYEREYIHTIKPLNFEPGDLVQVRNTAIEKNLDRKMFPRYFGPCVVIRRTKGGSYILAEMDGTLLRGKYGAFRILPHAARYHIDLPTEIKDLIQLSKDELEAMANEDEPTEYELGVDYIFDRAQNLRLNGNASATAENDNEIELPSESEDPMDDPVRVTRSAKKKVRFSQI
jgi:hypothetical protein